VALAVILVAARNKTLLKNYVHPLWMQLAGWFVVVAMTVLCVITIYNWLR
jgi:Mn2+/Fe2+ NRAMP family transporter